MTYKTHLQGGLLSSVVGFMLLRHNGLLLDDVSYFTQWLTMYPFTLWGSTACDYDHGEDNIPSKDYASVVVYKILHLTTPTRKRMEEKFTDNQLAKNKMYKFLGILDSRHRSWQTHSTWTVELLFLFLFCLTRGVLFRFGRVEGVILTLIVVGITTGVIEHLLLDILTPDGIKVMEFVLINKYIFKRKILPEHLRIVPAYKAKFFKKNFIGRFIKRKFSFSTGSQWELWVRKWLVILTKVAILVSAIILLYPYIKEYIPFEFRRYF